MRVLEALKILEDATLNSKNRDIDTPEVREALDALDPYCDPKWRVDGFRNSLQPHKRDIGVELEGQQQVLRVYFSGIHDDVRRLLLMQVGRLAFRYTKTTDCLVKAELDRLNAALEKLPERWNRYVR
jgi:hypothetical protein